MRIMTPKDTMRQLREQYGYAEIKRTERCWRMLRYRCNTPTAQGYQHYGGRGIKVCANWDHFINFFDDMGVCPDGYSIERKDVHGNYTKENCIWATKEQQDNNKQNTLRITYAGKTQSLAQWCRELGYNYQTMRHRLVYLGWTIDVAFTEPIDTRKSVRYYAEL